MTPTLGSSRAGCSFVVLAILLCSHTVIAWTDGRSRNNDSVQCRNDFCNNRDSYAPKHFILVHGMGGGAWFWFEIVTLLEQFGYRATAIDLASHGINKDVADDVITVAEYTKPLIDAIDNTSGPVILVGHSLGGGVIAYASEVFSSKVSKAIYLSAVMPSYNQSMFGGFPADTFPNLINPGYLTLNFKKGPSTPSSATLNVNALDKYYMSETPKRFVNLAKVLMTDTPYVPGTETLPLTPVKYGTVRRFYIRTGKDKGVSPADQDTMIAANPPEKVFCMPNGDHAVFFSAPMELYRLLVCISSQ